MAQLDETIEPGQVDHIADHQKLASKANYVFDVMDYGATGDGTTDDTDACQAAIDAAIAASGTVLWPIADVRYAVTSLEVGATNGGLRLQGEGMGSTIRSSGDTFDFTGTVLYLRMADLALETSGAGKACLQFSNAGSINQSTIRDCYFHAFDATGHAIDAVGATWEMQDNLWLNNTYSADGSSLSVPIINMIDTRGSVCNAQSFIGGRIIGSTGATSVQVFLECQNASAWAYNNRFQDINVEIAPYGFLQANGQYGLVIDNVEIADTTLAADCIVLSKYSTTGLNTRQTLLQSVWFLGNAGGSYDILDADGGWTTTVIASGGVTGTSTLNAGNGLTVIGGEWSSITNQDARYTTRIETDSGFQVGYAGYYGFGGETGPEISSGADTPEGAITAPIGSLFLRNNGGAGTTLYVKESGTGNTGWVAMATSV